MTKTELEGYFTRYAHLDREWCALYDKECETGKASQRMRQIQLESEAIVDELAMKLGGIE